MTHSEYVFGRDLTCLYSTFKIISGGKLNWIDVINNFRQNFKPSVDETIAKRNSEIIDVLDAELGAHFFPPSGEESSRKCKQCGVGRLGLKFGKY